MWRVIGLPDGPTEEAGLLATSAPASSASSGLVPLIPHHHHHHHHHHHQQQNQTQQQQQQHQPYQQPHQQQQPQNQQHQQHQQQQLVGPPIHHWAYLPPPPPPLQPLVLPPSSSSTAAITSTSSSLTSLSSSVSSSTTSTSSTTSSTTTTTSAVALSHGYPHEQQEHAGVIQNTSPSQQQQQQQRASVKRPMSDSDCDDVFSEESGKEPCNSPGGDSCQHTSRKRRRGMIEKKRRDRINASLGELRRLVPAAARDPHSGKLEKAEILQLTVEHLRTLKNKGAEGYDSSKLAMDYHAVGWGECAAEVGRYLVTMEGLDERDPFRLRLLSHLQSFQRAAEQPPQQPQPSPQTHLQQQQQQQQHHHQQQQQQQHHLQVPYGPESSTTTSATHPLAPWPAAQYSQYGHQQQGKPYRPWGAELAY